MRQPLTNYVMAEPWHMIKSQWNAKEMKSSDAKPQRLLCLVVQTTLALTLALVLTLEFQTAIKWSRQSKHKWYCKVDNYYERLSPCTGYVWMCYHGFHLTAALTLFEQPNHAPVTSMDYCLTFKLTICVDPYPTLKYKFGTELWQELGQGPYSQSIRKTIVRDTPEQ